MVKVIFPSKLSDRISNEMTSYEHMYGNIVNIRHQFVYPFDQVLTLVDIEDLVDHQIREEYD